MKETVAHYVYNYLFITGSWLYGQIKNMKQFEYIVCTYIRENKDIFPASPVYSLCDDLSYFERNYNQLHRRMFGYHPYFMAQISKNKAKLIHAHFGNAGYELLKLKNRLKLPLITSFYGFDASQLARAKKWRNRYKKLFKDGEAFLVLGEYMKKSLVSLGCPEEKIIVQKLGIDLKNIDFIPRVKESNKDTNFLIGASFREKKGIKYGIEAFAEVKRLFTDVKLKIIGDGPLKKEIISTIDSLGIKNDVHLMGYKPYSVFLEEVKKCHIFLMPSVTADNGDAEGTPVALMDVQASGMPVIATMHSGIPEVVVDEVTGFLVPERNVRALAEKMIYLLENPECWSTIGKEGRKHIEENYNVKLQTDKLEQIYAKYMTR